MERGSSVLESGIRNRESPGSNLPFAPVSNLGILVPSTDAPVHAAV